MGESGIIKTASPVLSCVNRIITVSQVFWECLYNSAALALHEITPTVWDAAFQRE